MGIESGFSHRDEKVRQPEIEVGTEKRPEKHEKVFKPSQIRIVQLGQNDWEILRELKLRSLGQEPIAFEDQETGLKRYSARSEEEWRRKLDEEASSTISLFADDNGRYIGTVNAILELDEKKALVQHMYVDPEGNRGKGIGRKLLTTLIDKLKERVDIEKAELAVVETQRPARLLYESLGFKEIRRVRTRRGNEIFTEIEMELEL